jgi:hypothetical protein
VIHKIVPFKLGEVWIELMDLRIGSTISELDVRKSTLQAKGSIHALNIPQLVIDKDQLLSLDP